MQRRMEMEIRIITMLLKVGMIRKQKAVKIYDVPCFVLFSFVFLLLFFSFMGYSLDFVHYMCLSLVVLTLICHCYCFWLFFFSL